MTRAAILSMQRIQNYGSTLQAHSLRRLLEATDPALVVRFGDYRPGPTLLSEVSPRRAGRVTRKVRETFAVRSKFRDKFRYLRYKQHYAAHYLPLIDVSAEPNYDLDLDLEVIGSDEVFNCVQDNQLVGYSRDLFGHGSPAGRVISYAASFGNTTLRRLKNAGVEREVADDLRRFAALSVRDQNSADVVQALTGLTPEIHLDPTCVHELMAEERIPPRRLHSDRYIISYGYSGRFSDAENGAIRDFAGSIGARVLAFGGLQDSADEFIDCDPFALLAYFRDAEAVVTDTFHGTIFSIINERPFATFIRRSEGHRYGNEEKLGHLLNIFDLSNRGLTVPTELGALLTSPIDYTQVRAVRTAERVRTLEYLRCEVAAAGATK